METSEEEDNLNDSDKEHEIEGEAIVKYDFIPEKTFELQLRKVCRYSFRRNSLKKLISL
jgi:hypothetical protein